MNDLNIKIPGGVRIFDKNKAPIYDIDRYGEAMYIDILSLDDATNLCLAMIKSGHHWPCKNSIGYLNMPNLPRYHLGRYCLDFEEYPTAAYIGWELVDK